jgi:hypothetical protein
MKRAGWAVAVVVIIVAIAAGYRALVQDAGPAAARPNHDH